MRDHKLVETVLYLHKQFEKAEERLDMTTSQYHLLHFLHEEPRRATDFSVMSKLRKPAITAMVAQLERRGWIERAPDPSDGRAQIIRITRPGMAGFRQFEIEMQAALDAFLGKSAMRAAERAIAEFYEHWNEKRIERFQTYRRGEPHDETDPAPGAVAGGRTRRD